MGGGRSVYAVQNVIKLNLLFISEKMEFTFCPENFALFVKEIEQMTEINADFAHMELHLNDGITIFAKGSSRF